MKLYKIKPLKWMDSSPCMACAVLPGVGQYTVYFSPTREAWLWKFDGEARFNSGVGNHFNHCKELAEAHWLEKIGPSLEEVEPDADLLEALKKVVAIADRKTVEFDEAKAAIARAEGREP